MKKTQKQSALFWALGVILVALGVAICSKANLGVSMIAAPAFIVSEFLMKLWGGFSVGVTEYLLQAVLLAVLCLAVRRFRPKYLLAFGVAVIYGYTLNLFLYLLEGVVFDSTALRWVMLIIGDIITAFGVACFFRTEWPLQVYELFVAELASRFEININKVKWCFDLSLLAVSVLLACLLFGDLGSLSLASFAEGSFHSIGLGTLVTTAINSPIIAAAGKIISQMTDFFEKNAPKSTKKQ